MDESTMPSEATNNKSPEEGYIAPEFSVRVKRGLFKLQDLDATSFFQIASCGQGCGGCNSNCGPCYT